jgi:hypothetical protein
MLMSADEEKLSAIQSEIGQIPWNELARFFAQGAAIAVSPDIDLADAALQFTNDNSSLVRQWMQDGKVVKVSDELAKVWFESQATVRAIVVNPWVLVQSVSS